MGVKEFIFMSVARNFNDLILKADTTVEVPFFMKDKSIFDGVTFAYDAMVIFDKLSDSFYKKNGQLLRSDELANALQNMKGHTRAVGGLVVDKDGVLQTNVVLKKVENGKIVSAE